MTTQTGAPSQPSFPFLHSVRFCLFSFSIFGCTANKLFLRFTSNAFACAITPTGTPPFPCLYCWLLFVWFLLQLFAGFGAGFWIQIHVLKVGFSWNVKAKSGSLIFLTLEVMIDGENSHISFFLVWTCLLDLMWVGWFYFVLMLPWIGNWNACLYDQNVIFLC